MSTFGTMTSRIADEMLRSDLTSQIQSAIQSAIRHYSGTRFWFNEATATTADGFGPTASGTEYYSLPTDFQAVDTITATISDVYQLVPESFNEIDRIQQSASYHTGQPWKYAIYRQMLRLYPIPDGTYTLRINYVKSLTALSADADTNAWMTDGEELIRCRAKRDVYIHVLEDQRMAEAMSKLESDALAQLRGRTAQRSTPTRIAATSF